MALGRCGRSWPPPFGRGDDHFPPDSLHRWSQRCADSLPCTRDGSAWSEVHGCACRGGTVFEGFSTVVGEVPVRGRSLTGMGSTVNGLLHLPLPESQQGHRDKL